MGREELRFKSFSERVASISIDVIHRINRDQQYIVGATETHFKASLDKWLELNCTQKFTELVNFVGPDVYSLPHLLHAKDGIFKVLQQQLGEEKSPSLEANLELVVALARDLQDQFYPEFATFFTVITSTHLQQRDADVLEKVFTCLAYLFKFQWRFMVEDIESVFDLYKPLLSERHQDHTKAFAAESFAFLLRKVADKKYLLNIIFGHADRDSSLARGLGVLFFEVLKGVKTRVHSCAEQMFPLIMQRLAHRSGDSTDTRLIVIRTMLELLCNHLTPDYSQFLWKTLKECLLSSGDLTPSHFAALCQCYGEVISFKDGKLASLNPDDICNTFAKAFSQCPEEAFPHLLDASALALTVCEERGAKEIFVSNVLEAFSVSEQIVEEDALLKFMDNLAKLNCFHETVVPILWKYSEQQEGRRALRLLSKLESLAGMKIHCAASLVEWKPLVCLQRIERSSLSDYLFATLTLTKENVENIEHLECFWESCCLVRHLQSLWDSTKVVEQLQKALRVLIKRRTMDLLQLACIQECVRSLVVLKVSVDPKCLMLVLRKYKDPFILRSMDLAVYSTTEKDSHLQTELFSELWWLLTSPYAIVRFLALRILSQFEPPEKKIPKGKFAACRYMLALEGIAVTVQEFKNRNNLMEKLRFETVLRNAVDPTLHRFTLAFLFGQLHISFSQLWSTVKKLIATYMDYEKFWEVMNRQFDETTKAIQTQEHFIGPPISNEIMDTTLVDLLTVKETYENVDYDLHRVLLWNVVEQVTDAAIVSDVPYKYFLNLFEEEFRPRSEFIASERVLKEHLLSDNENDMDVKMDEDGAIIIDDSDVEDDNVRPEGNTSIMNDTDTRKSTNAPKYGIRSKEAKAITPGRKCVASLKAALTALAHSELKQLEQSKREEFEERFGDLLMYPEAAIQKLALECLLACGVSVLHCCKENLMKLLDDKEWMNVLNESFLANDTSSVQRKNEAGREKTKQMQRLPDKQRKKVLPYVMRLLFGRMLTKKTGHRSKSRVASKHAAVLRFLASSRESDLIYFIELILLPLRRYNISVDDDDGVSTERLLENVSFDPENAVPVRRIRQVLNNIRHVLNHMSGVLPTFLPLLLRSVLLLLRYSNLVTQRAGDINRLYSQSIKRARMLCVDIVYHYFTQLDRFAMKLNDVHLFFELYVWRTLQELVRFPGDPSARVFRLFLCFAQKENLQFLLGLKSRDDPTRTIMSDLMTILGTSSAHPDVVKSIRDVIKYLLSDVAPDETVARIIYSLEDVDLHDNTEPSTGFRIALPYTFVIISRSFEQMKEYDRPMHPVDRFILFKLSKYNTDPALASNMLVLLASMLHKKSRAKKNEDDTFEYETLCIIKNLIVAADSVADIYLSLCRMWAIVEGRNSRNVLLNVFQMLSTKMSGIDAKVCDILGKLNSWDARLTEEPAYLQRIKGFRELVALTEAMKIPEVQTALPLIHSCIYTSLRSSDLSLRDAATYALFKLITFCHDVLGEGHEVFFKTCVEQEIYGSIKKGFRSNEETTRHECVKILTHILNTCGKRALFKELKSFQDTEKEKDFFECIVHIQLHRRARALIRLSTALSARHISARSIMDVFLPLTESFLLKEEYAKQNIAEAAIQNLGSLASKLPWRQYARLLEKYILLLSNKELCSVRANQKCIVKIIVTLLDAFHFDLSQLVSVFEENATTSTTSSLPLRERLAPPDAPISLDAAVDLNMTEQEEAAEEIKEGLPTVNESGTLPPDGMVTVVDVKVGKEILQTLKDVLLCKLQSAITRKGYYSTDGADDDNEENDVLRVSIAVGVVKLLSILPSKTFLRTNLSSVLLKVIVFLKSRLLPVRETARSALVKIINILGPCYLKYVIREMRSLLSRGFQLHVLTFTVHAILEAVRSQMQPGDLDECTDDILEICLEEQFGEVADEKDITGITAKTDEAKRTKSLDMFRIVAAVVSEDQLQRLLDAVEVKLLAGHSARIVSKCEKIFEQLTSGLETNKGLSKVTIFIFCYKLLNENTHRLLITDPVLAKELKGETDSQRGIEDIDDTNRESTLPYERPDVFLVPKAPVRSHVGTLVSHKANVHVLVESALKLLRDILRKNRGQEMNKHLNMLDPFVAPLCQLQRSSYVKVTTLSMIVIQQLLHYPLPAFQAHLHIIISTAMSIIHKYLGTTQQSGPNYEMLIAAFKTVRTILNEVETVELDEEQYKMLLTYIETDICDVERQGVAFSLLAAVIDKGVNLPELHSLMRKVAEMSIQEEVTAIRNQARTLYQKYLFDYPIEPKLREKCVAFYLGQLEYSVEEGRQSAAEMVYQIIKLYPENLLAKSALFFFVPLSASLVNDGSVIMRKMCYGCLKAFLEKLNNNSRTSLYALAKKWLQDVSKVQKQFLGAQVIGCFAEVEKEQFAIRVDDLMNIFVKLVKAKDDADQIDCEVENNEREQDRLVYLIWNSTIKILSHVRLLESETPAHRAICSSLMSSCQAHLLYPHSWVRVAASRIFGLLFARYEPRKLAQTICKDEKSGSSNKQREAFSGDWLPCGGRSLIDKLVISFLEQFQSRQVPNDLLDQLVKNLLFVGKVLLYLSHGTSEKTDRKLAKDASDKNQKKDDESTGEFEYGREQTEGDNNQCGQSDHRTFGWFVFKIEKELRVLRVNNRTPNYEKRTCLYKLLAALSLECPREVLQCYSHNFLRPLVRDLESTAKDQDFYQLVKDASHVIRREMGFEQYQEGYARQLTELARIKAHRKQSKAVEKVLNPEVNLERKERRKRLDKTNRKRMLDERRGKIQYKKPKYEADEIARVNREAENGKF